MQDKSIGVGSDAAPHHAEDMRVNEIDVRIQFGGNLSRARKRAGLSQEALAERAEMHRTEIGLLERAGRMPKIDTFVKLAGALAVEPCDLLDGIRWEPGHFKPGRFNGGAATL